MRPALAVRTLTLALMALALAGCHSTPCLTCHAMLFKGVSAKEYLRVHPKPSSVTDEPDGGHTYQWLYSNDEQVPGFPPSYAGGPEAAGSGGGKSPWTLVEFALSALSGKGDPKVQPSTVKEVLYIVKVKVDRHEAVLHYSCQKLVLNLSGVHLD